MPFPQSPNWVALTLGLVALMLVVVLVMKLVRYAVRTMALWLDKEREAQSGTAWAEDVARGIRPAVAVLVILLATLIGLRVSGHSTAQRWTPSLVLDWLLTRGLRITLVVVCAYLVLRSVQMLVSKTGVLIRPQDDTPASRIEAQKRGQTIQSILERISTVVVVILTALMLLGEFGINTVPILTGLGVVGVAVGFGAQWLVGDLIAGFFHIFENQIRVGDVAVINGTSGLVQDLRLRTTILRGFDGAVYVFRNGAITTLANLTKDYSYFTMDVTVHSKEDPDHVAPVLREVAEELSHEAPYSAFILAPLEIFGVESFSESSLVIRMRLKTIPSKQWEVGREFRKRLKRRMEKEGIALPEQVATPSVAAAKPGP